MLGLVFAIFVPVTEPGFMAIVYSLAAGSELPKWLWAPVPNRLFGAFLPAFFLWFAGWLYYKIRHREGLGFGDVKLVAMVGSFLGVLGALQTLILGSIAGSVIGYGYIKLTGKDPASYELPFGTSWAPPPCSSPYSPTNARDVRDWPQMKQIRRITLHAASASVSSVPIWFSSGRLLRETRNLLPARPYSLPMSRLVSARRRERLLQKGDFLLQDAGVDDRVVRVAGHVQHFHARRAAQPAPRPVPAR